ncbi:helix-turn-helix domain-containing protein [Citricoccus sp. NR2]|uniref:helix-turn-helix domain-containing protein n=1 Tax=Citricoccus sp. NR2 TaxID=3004095 RepID=UPI0022DD44B2|nr:helix-turn-helix transcriptional regulator [Citricoccus sp. NR2]WBL18472.1 helix-turn-helix transcriptional regulator [Citricoccus sp. NR2]
MNQRIAMRINKQGFRDYLEASEMSQREFARRAKVSHTLVQQMLTDSKKTHVRVSTAKSMEKVLKCPGNLIFFPEVFTVVANAA